MRLCRPVLMFTLCLFFVSFLGPAAVSATDFKEMTFVFNPKVQFEFSEDGVKEYFYKEGNTVFHPFKAIGNLKGRTFKGLGLGKIEKGKIEYGCAIEATFDETFNSITHFKLEVNTKEVTNKKLNNISRCKYVIEGKSLPLSLRSSHEDYDHLMFSVKGPLAKKNITTLQVNYTINSHKQVAKNKWVPKRYWKKSVDYKFGRNDGVFLFINAKVNESLSGTDKTERVYDIEKSATGEIAQPTMDFKLSMVDKKKMDGGPYALSLKFNAKATLESKFYGKDVKQSEIIISPLAVPKQYQWKSDMVLDFKIPLFDILKQIYTDKGVYAHLIEKQFNPDQPKGIPEETRLTVDLKLAQATYRAKTDKKRQRINPGNGHSFQNQFILGPEIDLAKQTKLKTGKGHAVDWHDLSGVMLAAAKSLTSYDKLQAAYTITDCMIQAHGGYTSVKTGNFIGGAESAGSVAGATMGFDDSLKGVSDNLGLLFLIPQLKRLVYDEFWGTPALIRQVEDGMRKLNYFPLSQGRATKNFPIWLNPKEKKLALIDPAGLVHPVKPPKNFHISWAFFKLEETVPAGKSLLFKIQDESGWSKWWTLGGPLVKNHKILPPTRTHFPLRMKLPTPAGYTGQKKQAGFGAVRSVRFSHSKNSQLILDRGEDYDGIVDFGWEDTAQTLVYEKPYLTLVSGRLRAKNETSRIGIGFYKWKKDQLKQYLPQLWCEPKGTEYVIDFNPANGKCTVEVIDGRVDIRDSNDRIIDHIPAGSKKEYDVPMDDYLNEIFETQQVESENLKGDTVKGQHSGSHQKGKQQASDPAPKKAISPPLVQKNYLGILLPNQSKELIVVNTFPDSPARTAGIRMGDRLLAFDHRDLKGVRPETFGELVRSASPKKSLDLKIKRGGTIKTLNIALEWLPEKLILERRNVHKKEAGTYYQKAEEQKKQKNYKAAEPLYAKAMSLDPTRTLSYDYRAYCLDKTGNRKSAYKLLEMSLLLADKMYNNYLYGKFLSYDEQYRQAVPYLEKASKSINQDGSYYFPFHELGGAKFMLDDHKGAIEALLISEKMGDSRPLTIGTLGVCFDKTGDKKRAITYYRRYLSMNDSNQQMIRMARTRLAKLERSHSHQKKNSDKSFSKALNLILDEVHKAK